MFKGTPRFADATQSKRLVTKQVPNVPRSQSDSPTCRNESPLRTKCKGAAERRCQSLSPASHATKKVTNYPQKCASAPTDIKLGDKNMVQKQDDEAVSVAEKSGLPHFVVSKVTRTLQTKKREFMKLKKTVIFQQNTLLDQYAAIKELESRIGVTNGDESVGEVRLMSMNTWPAHDLLMLIRDDIQTSMLPDVSGVIGPQLLQQIQAQLSTIPNEVVRVTNVLLERRYDILLQLRQKHRADRSTYHTNLEWKTKNTELEQETDSLQRMIAAVNDNLTAKISFIYKLTKTPWVDREELIKKIEKLNKENLLLLHKAGHDNNTKKEKPRESEESLPLTKTESSSTHQVLAQELNKERTARESLKEMVSNAENLLRAARTRVSTLERQLKDTRTELEVMKKKHKDLDQLYRHRESSYDARSKKLMELSKTGEAAIETLSRQRDALELRVRELREQAEAAENEAEQRAAGQRARADMLQAKVAAQEKNLDASQQRATELETKVKEFEKQLQSIRERTAKFLRMEQDRCFEFVPVKENEPSDRETEIWKELQVTRVALSKAEEELRRSRADKDNFLNSLSRIAQVEGSANIEDKMATELLERERKISHLQRTIEAQEENEKIMEQSMTQYENQLAELRLEVKRLRNYDFYVKDIPFEELQTEALDLHMKVVELTRERSALVSAAASRSLMLERHERAAELFTRVTRARKELAALLEGDTDPPRNEMASYEVTRSLTDLSSSAADTWSALRAERARVLGLEHAILTQSLQLEREGRVRTQLERRRAFLERNLLRQRGSTGGSNLYNDKTASQTVSRGVMFSYNNIMRP